MWIFPNPELSSLFTLPRTYKYTHSHISRPDEALRSGMPAGSGYPGNVESPDIERHDAGKPHLTCLYHPLSSLSYRHRIEDPARWCKLP